MAKYAIQVAQPRKTHLMVISLHIRLRYEVPVEVEVDQDILPSVVIDPGHGELVGMASLVLCGVAGLDLGL